MTIKGGKKTIVVFSLITALCLIFMAMKIKTGRKSIREKAKSFKAKKYPAENLTPQKKTKIKPIVIKHKPAFSKPKSLNAKDWDAYSRELFTKMKSEMSPEFQKKMAKELKRRERPETEENVKKLEKYIENLQKEVLSGPLNKKKKEKLKKLLEVQGKYRAMEELFLK